MNGWTAVVPVKPWRLAKSRLRSSRRLPLARAFSLDTLEALGCSERVGQVVVVSSEQDVILPARSVGAALVQDRPLRSADGLNAAVDLGRQWAVSRFPDRPIVVVPADLPCLSADVLDDVLARAGACPTAFVPDARGDGTTLLTARDPRHLPIAYGPGSASLHARAGARMLSDVDPRARRDVDTLEDLGVAVHLGVGPHTRTVVGLPLRVAV